MANKYWVGGGSNTNWNASPVTNWANTDGGAGNQTAPAAGDAVFFTANSGTGAAVWNTTISLTGLTCTGSKNAISGSGGITLTAGNLVMPDGVGATYTGTNGFTFTATAGTQQITSNGKTIGGAITFNGAGGTFQTQDALTATAATSITLTAGTFDCQTNTVSLTSFASSGSGVRAIVGSGAWTITNANNGATNVFNIGVTTNLTVTSWTSALTFVNTNSTSGSNHLFLTSTGFDLSRNDVTVNSNSGGGAFTINNTVTLKSLTATGPLCLCVTQSKTITMATLTLAGTSSGPIYFGSDVPNSQATLSIASNAPSIVWTGIRALVCGGGATYAATNSFDLGLNSGITITGPGSSLPRTGLQAIEEGQFP